MREILFKSKRKDNETWISGGSLMHTIEGMYILPTGNNVTINKTTNTIISLDVCEIIPETLSQYIGMKDKNGTKIFDGDIVKISIVTHADHKVVEWGKAIIVFKNGAFCAKKLQTMVEITPLCNFANNVEFEIIGNVWDNADIL